MDQPGEVFRALDGSHFATERERRRWNLWLATVALIIVGSLVVWLLIISAPVPSPVAKSFRVPPTRFTQNETASVPTRRAPSTRVIPPDATPGVVWVNTRSKIYHYPGYAWYGTTQAGKYLSERDAVAEGDRAALNERRPAIFYPTPRP